MKRTSFLFAVTVLVISGCAPQKTGDGGNKGSMTPRATTERAAHGSIAKKADFTAELGKISARNKAFAKLMMNIKTLADLKKSRDEMLKFNLELATLTVATLSKAVKLPPEQFRIYVDRNNAIKKADAELDKKMAEVTQRIQKIEGARKILNFSDTNKYVKKIEALQEPLRTLSKQYKKMERELGQGAKRPTSQPEGHHIKLHRPVQVGSRYKVDVSYDISAGLFATPWVASKIRGEAEVTVKAVHSCGKASKVEVKVVFLKSYVDKGDAKTLLPAGSIGTVEGPDLKHLKATVGGKPASREATVALAIVGELCLGDHSKADDLYGTVAAIKPGDSWQPNFGKVLSGLVRRAGGIQRFKAQLGNLSGGTGEMRVVAAKQRSGIDGLEYNGQLSFTSSAVKARPGTPRAPNFSSYVRVSLSGWVPSNPKNSTRLVRYESWEFRSTSDVKKPIPNTIERHVTKTHYEVTVVIVRSPLP